MEWASFICETGPFHFGLGTKTSRVYGAQHEIESLLDTRQDLLAIVAHASASSTVPMNNSATIVFGSLPPSALISSSLSSTSSRDIKPKQRGWYKGWGKEWRAEKKERQK
ncbi:unnamed protein product [Timema podura]|uniref:Uncharacterized protein n=1 Tax=Timema podura TaxID=61482 RepID=A0ABN7P1G7_TIMPD|nr:unnamed protein product [Timema podura]